MATETGILQALWGELRPAAEAREPSALRPLARLALRGRAEEAIRTWTELLALPPSGAEAVLLRMARRTAPAGDPSWARADDLRAWLWSRIASGDIRRSANSRILFDEPFPDRIWLARHGAWIFYRWDGTRFLGHRLTWVLDRVSGGAMSARESLLEVAVLGRTYPNPKLPIAS